MKININKRKVFIELSFDEAIIITNNIHAYDDGVKEKSQRRMLRRFSNKISCMIHDFRKKENPFYHFNDFLNSQEYMKKDKHKEGKMK